MMRRDFLKTATAATVAGLTGAAMCHAGATIPPAAAAAEVMARRRARESLLAFTTYTMPDYRVWWHHRLMAEALDRWECGQSRRLMVFAPPQHGKSELDNRRLPAYMLGRNPDRGILSCSYAMPLAQAMNRDVQRIMLDASYQRLFPGTRISENGGEYRRTMSYFEVMGHRGFLRAAGVQQGIAGYPAHAGIIDDPFGSREDAESKTIRDKVEEWYWADFVGRLSKDAPVLIVNTRWNLDDLAGKRILGMAKEDGEQWEIVAFQAIKSERYPHAHPQDPRQVGEALWPAHKSVQDLETIQGANPRIFAALYQQDPTAAGALFDPRWFEGDDLWFDAWPPAAEGYRIITLDSSTGKGGRWGDYSAFIILHYYRGLVYVEGDLDNTRNDNAMAIRAMELIPRFNPQIFVLEEEFGGGGRREAFVLHAQQRGMTDCLNRFMLLNTSRESGQKVEKTQRIRALEPRLAFRRLRFKRGSIGTQLLVQQLKEFPNGDHDDGPDGLEMGLWMLTRGGIEI